MKVKVPVVLDVDILLDDLEYVHVLEYAMLRGQTQEPHAWHESAAIMGAGAGSEQKAKMANDPVNMANPSVLVGNAQAGGLPPEFRKVGVRYFMYQLGLELLGPVHLLGAGEGIDPKSCFGRGLESEGWAGIVRHGSSFFLRDVFGRRTRTSRLDHGQRFMGQFIACCEKNILGEMRGVCVCYLRITRKRGDG